MKQARGLRFDFVKIKRNRKLVFLQIDDEIDL